MKGWLFLLGMLWVTMPLRAAEDVPCGDDGLTCSGEERCCEHIIANFAGDHASTPPYVTGQCVPKEQKCNQFWCGNQECKSGFFGTPSVCCIHVPMPNSTPEYACAYSDLSCPGNSQRLTIRDAQPQRTLRRG